MHCIYSGNFNEEHKIKRKRRVRRPVIFKSANSWVNEGIAYETYKEEEAVRLMKVDKKHIIIVHCKFYLMIIYILNVIMLGIRDIYYVCIQHKIFLSHVHLTLILKINILQVYKQKIGIYNYVY